MKMRNGGDSRYNDIVYGFNRGGSKAVPKKGLVTAKRLLYFALFCIVSVLAYEITYDWLFVLGYTREVVCGTPVTPASMATLQGRIDKDFPSPRCCVDEECLSKSKGRHAVLTTLRSDNYLPLLEHLSCSMKKSNPKMDFIVATVKGDLSESVEGRLKAMSNVKIHYWEEFRVENKLRDRFALNWVKLRAWEMEEYDMILMIDGDSIVVDKLDPLWSLPAHFATVLDMDKMVSTYSSLGRQQGGVVLLRPCKPVADHMMNLVKTNETLQFATSHAEQSFLDWYFRFDRWSLPIKYNAIATLLKDGGMKTNAGTKPVIIHYSGKKPFELTPDVNLEQKAAICD